MPHDPTVTAAVVSAVVSVGAAGVSWVTAVWTTRRTLDAGTKAARKSVQAEREHKLWEKRTEVYKNLLDFIAESQSLDFGLKLDLNLRFLRIQDQWDEISHDIVMYGSDEVDNIAHLFYDFHAGLIFKAGGAGKADPQRTEIIWQAVLREGIRGDGHTYATTVRKQIRHEMQKVD